MVLILWCMTLTLFNIVPKFEWCLLVVYVILSVSVLHGGFFKEKNENISRIR